MSLLQRFFELKRHRTSVGREVIAGLTTFTTMSYIVVVNPAILRSAGVPVGPSFVATVLAAVFGCVLMGLYARRPFAIAPYMGENAFIAFTLDRAGRLRSCRRWSEGAELVRLKARSRIAQCVCATLSYVPNHSNRHDSGHAS